MEPRHVEVEEHDIWTVLLDEHQRVSTRERHLDVVAGLEEIVPKHLDHGSFIIDQKDATESGAFGGTHTQPVDC